MGGLIGPWGAVLSTLVSFPKDFEDARNKALRQEAEFFRNKILEGIREQSPGGKAFKPLSPTTIAVRKFFGVKGTKALIEHGDLRNSIVVQVIGEEVFVGILRTAHGADGHSLVDVATILEEGTKPIVIKMTPKMAALLHAAMRAGGGATNRMGPPPPSTGMIIVQIPARPFLQPIMDKYGDPAVASARFAERFKKAMAGKGIWDRVEGAI